MLEDFDRFTAKRQAVLYNMLDTMHGPDMQVLHCHCAEMLSHNYIFSRICKKCTLVMVLQPSAGVASHVLYHSGTVQCCVSRHA